MAIAFDAVGGSASTGTTVSHVVGSGADRFLFAEAYSSSAKHTACTYGGVSMTKLCELQTGNGSWQVIFGLVAPAIGTANIVVSGGSGTTRLRGISYSGMQQSTTPDAITQVTEGSATSFTVSVTTVADNCWTILFHANASGNPVAGTGSTLRVGTFTSIFDSNGAITPAGSYSMETHTSSASTPAITVISMAPPSGGGALLRHPGMDGGMRDLRGGAHG